MTLFSVVDALFSVVGALISVVGALFSVVDTLLGRGHTLLGRERTLPGCRQSKLVNCNFPENCQKICAAISWRVTYAHTSFVTVDRDGKEGCV